MNDKKKNAANARFLLKYVENFTNVWYNTRQ